MHDYFLAAARGRTREYQRGATLVEFALTVPLFLILFLFMVDASVVLYRHLRLSHVTTELTRTLSTKLGERMEIMGGTVDCLDIVSTANQVIADYRAANPLMSQGFNLDLLDIRGNVPPYPLISVRGSWAGSCIACMFFNTSSGMTLQAQSVLVIENNNPITCNACGGVACVPT